jgi:hypothetical protein
MGNVSLQYFNIVFQKGNKHNFEIYNHISTICVDDNALIKTNLSHLKLGN